MILADYIIFGIYFIIVLGVGFYFFLNSSDREDYYVGGRKIPASHVGMSIVATDVGGGFSIGLGGLGFMMGISGSWLLFTGLTGAWLAAVFMIPKIKSIDSREGMLTYPDFLRFHYGQKVALTAAVISAVGYMGFTGAQVLAGAKLAAATLFTESDPAAALQTALFIMTAVVLIYTVLGGIKAVIYTDTIQWIILLSGLLFLGIPFALIEAGGWEGIRQALPPEFFSLSNISFLQFFNWFITIVPIWFIAMTLYQRIYSVRNTREARKAFYIAGLLEYPLMAFIGVFLGMVARIFFPEAEAELAMPLLLKEVLPPLVTGVVIASYFSAIMSTADSCLIASSGNIVNDIFEQTFMKDYTEAVKMKISRWMTLGIGLLTYLIAREFTTVLDLILHSYSFMVAGLFIPTLGAYFWKRSQPLAALISMIGGGSITLILIFTSYEPIRGLDPTVYGITVSAILFISISILESNRIRIQ